MRRLFDGKRYDFWQEFPDKKSAQEEAERIKESGMAKSTRVVQEQSRLHKYQRAWAVYYISSHL